MSKDRDERRRASWGARILAPIALVAAGVVVAMIVAGALDGADGSEEATQEERPGRTVEGCTPTEPDALRDGYYVVEAGEPGLSAVAANTCVPIERIERLNQNLPDPQLIPQGACVNLRPDGCQALSGG